MVRFIILALASISLLIVSRSSILNPHSHGFHRFFAWEAILGLILLNVPVWFKNPLSWNQIISWFLLVVSLIPLALGAYMLYTAGEPNQSQRVDSELLAFEKTTKLVRSGIYRYIRHPLYSSLVLLNWGAFFKRPNLPGTLLTIIATIFLIATAKTDERECIQIFGADYRDYMKQTKMFIPYIF